MISIRFEEKQQIGLQYALETLHGCSPFGQEKIRRLRFYTPSERAELETELYNVQQAADHADQLKGVYDKISILLCQMKDIRNSIRRCRDGEVPDHVELFEIKGYLQRLESLLPLYAQLSEMAPLRELSFHDPRPALAILDPDNTRSRGFYIPDSMTEKLRQIRRTKKELEEQLHHAATDAEKDEIRLRRTQICAEEESEETKIRRDMGARLAPLAEDMLQDAESAGRLDFIIQKALFAVRYGGVMPEITDGALELTDMMNPELCDLLSEQGRSFVPVSISLEKGATVITGANMGGKTVSLRSTVLSLLLCQCGFFVFAKSASLPLFHRVDLILADSGPGAGGLSSFGKEVHLLDTLLRQTRDCFFFVAMDEFARGTNPQEGAALARALVRYLGTLDCVALMTTHYDGVSDVAGAHYQVAGLVRDIQGDEGDDPRKRIARRMDYHLLPAPPGAPCPRDALRVCRLLKLDDALMDLFQADL